MEYILQSIEIFLSFFVFLFSFSVGPLGLVFFVVVGILIVTSEKEDLNSKYLH